MRSPPAKVLELARKHRAFYEQTEKATFEKARNLYQGKKTDEGEASSTLAWNYIFGICQTAVASLLGNDVQIHAEPLERASVDKAQDASDVVNLQWELTDFQDELTMALVDAVLLGRGILKTRWDFQEGRVTIEAVDPAPVFFDLAARRRSGIRYWLHLTAVPEEVFKARLKGRSPIYMRPEKKVEPTHIPEWMSGYQSSVDPVAPDYVMVWEYYNRDGRVYHWLDSGDELLLEDTLDYRPFTVLELNSNGRDCRGLSEVALVTKLQEILNGLLNYVWGIVKVADVVTFYDASALNQDDVAGALAGRVGRFAGIRTNQLKGRPFQDCFAEAPQPVIPESVIKLFETLPTIIGHVSAISDLSRAQTVNAKHATELAMMDAQMRTLLKSKEGRLNGAIVDVAEKTLHLAATRRKKPQLVKRGDRYEEVKVDRSIRVRFKLTAYNALRASPLLEAETAKAFLPIAQAFPEVVDMESLVRHVYRMSGLPEAFLNEIEDEEEAGPDIEGLAGKVEAFLQTPEGQAMLQQLQQAQAPPAPAPGMEGLPLAGLEVAPTAEPTPTTQGMVAPILGASQAGV